MDLDAPMRLAQPEPQGVQLDEGPWSQTAAPDAEKWSDPQAWVRHYLHGIDPEAEATEQKYLVSNNPRGERREYLWYRRARFRYEGMPVLLASFGKMFTLTVAVRESTPELWLRPQTFGDGVAKLFGRRDAEVGDWVFDDRFLIDADDASAKALLTADVRADIQRICEFGEPALAIEKGLARIFFHSDGSKEPFLVALRIVRHVHGAKT